jgi:hypothetical protein
MAKKGSKKNPLILRLADESRVVLITGKENSIFLCVIK